MMDRGYSIKRKMMDIVTAEYKISFEYNEIGRASRIVEVSVANGETMLAFCDVLRTSCVVGSFQVYNWKINETVLKVMK